MDPTCTTLGELTDSLCGGEGTCCYSYMQGGSLGLERLGLEAVSRRFLERLGLISVLKVERLGLESLEKSNVSVSSWS